MNKRLSLLNYVAFQSNLTEHCFTSTGSRRETGSNTLKKHHFLGIFIVDCILFLQRT